MIPKVRITRRGLGAIILAIGAGLLITAVLPRAIPVYAQIQPARAACSPD